MSSVSQPKNLRKMIVRSSILLLVVAAMIFGYNWYRGFSQDIDLPADFDTSGYISAIRLFDEGSQAVVVKPDGEVLESPGYSDGKYDKDAVWRPDGHRLLFISDREENAQNVYRWNFGGGKVNRRTTNSRSKGIPAFEPGVVEGARQKALITSGGVVLELDTTDGSTRQIVPPVNKERVATSEDSGAASPFEAIYGNFGTSFREARWTPGRQFVIAVMRRDDGEALICQDLTEMKPPIPLALGDHVEFDIDPKSGKVVFLVLQFRLFDPNQAPKEFVKDGVIRLPFRHMVAQVDVTKLESDPQGSTQPIVQSNNDGAFQRVSISPDGARISLVRGRYDSYKRVFESEGLVLMPCQPGGAQNASPLLDGAVYEPSWHPNSNALAFVRYNAANERAVWTVNADGSELKELTTGKGDFAWPRFSPQSK